MENQRLITAIRRQNLDGIQEFLRRGGNVNGFLHDDMTPLIYAIDCCRKKPFSNSYNSIILCLINAGANVNVRHPRNNLTALMLALQNNRSEEVVRRLISAGSEVKANCVTGETILVHAVQNGYSKNIIAELIKKGADVNKPLIGLTPLYCALSCNRTIDIVELLINKGADVHIRDWCGRNLLTLPCQESCEIDGLCKYKEITDMLIKRGVDIKSRDKLGNTIIHNVNCNYIIYLALKNGVRIETKNHDDKTPLHQAILYFEQKKAKDLLLLNANPNCFDNFQNTPLQYGQVIYSEKLSSILLYHGADLLAENVNKSTPIKLMFKDFTENPINYFHDGIKVVIRHYLLFINENDLDDPINKSYFNKRDLFISYVKMCKIELRNMHGTFITEELTLYQFCQLKKLYSDKCFRISIDEYKYGYEQIRDLFPIYQDLIILRIKDNSKKKFRDDMIKNLERISVRPVSHCGTNSNVQLVYDCWYNIGQYLNFKELFSLFLASLER